MQEGKEAARRSGQRRVAGSRRQAGPSSWPGTQRPNWLLGHQALWVPCEPGLGAWGSWLSIEWGGCSLQVYLEWLELDNTVAVGKNFSEWTP